MRSFSQISQFQDLVSSGCLSQSHLSLIKIQRFEFGRECEWWNTIKGWREKAEKINHFVFIQKRMCRARTQRQRQRIQKGKKWNGSNGLVRSTVSKRDVNSMNQSVSPMLPSQLQQCVAKQIEKTLKRIKNFNTWFFLSFLFYRWSGVYFVLRAHYSFRFGSVQFGRCDEIPQPIFSA